MTCKSINMWLESIRECAKLRNFKKFNILLVALDFLIVPWDRFILSYNLAGSCNPNSFVVGSKYIRHAKIQTRN